MMKNVHEFESKLTDEWVKILDKTLNKKNKETTIDGFRKGKAPKEVFLKNYGVESLYMDSIDEAINIAYKKILEDNKLVPVVEPKVDVTNINKDEVALKFVIITKPEIELGNYKNLGVKKEKVKVSDKEIEEQINHLRQHLADVVLKENGAIADGDIAVIDFDGYVDGKALDGGKGENYPLEIGSHSFIPGFEEGLIGLKTGEEKELKLKFPENYLEELKNKDVTFKVKVNEIKTRVLPEIDQEFFEDLGYDDIKTEEEFRKKVKEDIEHQKGHEVNDKFLDECLEAAAKNVKIDINPEIIDAEVHRMLDQYAYDLKMQGLDINKYYEVTGTSEEKLHKEMEPEALKRVKYRYLIEAIADQEKVDFPEKEVKKRAEEMAEGYGITVEELIAEFGSMDVVKYDMKMHRALEILQESNE